MDELLAILRRHRLFAGLTETSLVSLAARFVERSVAPGELLFREGDAGESLTVVAAGVVQTSRRGEGGREVALSVLGPGDVAGLTSLVTGKAHSATLTAKETVRIFMLAREPFEALLRTEPTVERALLAHLAEKVRARSGDYARALAGTTDGRLPVAMFDSKDYTRGVFLESASDLSFRFFDVRLGLETVPLAEGAQVVCAFVNDRLDAPVLEGLAARGVSLLAMRCAGYNNVDLVAAERLGISVVRVPAYSPHAVAEHCVALMLTLNRKTHRAYARVRDGNFSLSGLVGFDMHGRTAGVVGVGAIGRCLVRILRGFGMRVLGWDRVVDEAFARETGLEYVELDTLLRESDVVSLHVPLLPATRHLIGAAELAKTKRGAMLVNTSRGGLVDTVALIDALKDGQLGSAGLDVYEEESAYFFEDHSTHVIEDDTLARLLTFPNVVVTSHQAFLTEDALRAIAETTVGSIREWQSGRRMGELTYAVRAP